MSAQILYSKALSQNPSQEPYRNRQLQNLRGEKWEEIPNTEGYYLISNFGRIKSLPRLVEVFIPKQQRSISYYTREKILTTKVREKWNSVASKPYYECTVSIRLNGKERGFMIGRLVYHAFVGELDFGEDRLMIMHKDGDGRNNHFKNLKAGLRSQVTQRAYDSNRHISPFALKTKAELNEIRKRAVKSRLKPIMQFSLKGKKLRRFESIKAASLQTGIPDSNIVNVLKGNIRSAGGYMWCYDQKTEK